MCKNGRQDRLAWQEGAMDRGYWQRRTAGRSISRRGFVGGATGLGIAAAAAGLVSCSSSNTNISAPPKPAASAIAAASAAASTAPSSTTRPATPAAANTPAALDSTKGKPGGTYKYMESGYPPAFTMIDQRSPHRFCAHTHSGMLAMHWGTQGVAYDDYSVEPDLAQALPE